MDASDISALAAKVTQMAAAIEELDYASVEDIELGERERAKQGKNGKNGTSEVSLEGEEVLLQCR